MRVLYFILNATPGLLLGFVATYAFFLRRSVKALLDERRSTCQLIEYIRGLFRANEPFQGTHDAILNHAQWVVLGDPPDELNLCCVACHHSMFAHCPEAAIVPTLDESTQELWGQLRCKVPDCSCAIHGISVEIERRDREGG